MLCNSSLGNGLDPITGLGTPCLGWTRKQQVYLAALERFQVHSDQLRPESVFFGTRRGKHGFALPRQRCGRHLRLTKISILMFGALVT
jgi:hypothetical protein